HLEAIARSDVPRIELETANALHIELHIERCMRVMPRWLFVSVCLDVVAVVRCFELHVIHPKNVVHRITVILPWVLNPMWGLPLRSVGAGAAGAAHRGRKKKRKNG